MEPRLSFVTLGVADVARARAFYEALGLRGVGRQQSRTSSFYDAGGVVLALFGRDALAEDATARRQRAGLLRRRAGAQCAQRGRGRRRAGRSGGGRRTLVKAAQKAFWGGYSGYFADPDGHLWEVAYNPCLPARRRGPRRSCRCRAARP